MKFVSDGSLALTGYPPVALVNKAKTHFENIVHPDGRERICDEVQQAIGVDQSFAMEYRIGTN